MDINREAIQIFCRVECEGVEIPKYLHMDIYPCAIIESYTDYYINNRVQTLASIALKIIELHELLHKQLCTITL